MTDYKPRHPSDPIATGAVHRFRVAPWSTGGVRISREPLPRMIADKPPPPEKPASWTAEAESFTASPGQDE